MTSRDPAAKRRQLLEAALAEFAQYGIAGARMDRIAKLAGCSAGLVYTYFGSKDDLFEAVYDEVIVRTVSEIPLTVDDLPGYAARLYEAQRAHPDVMRLAAWYQLERAGQGRDIPAVAQANQEKAGAIRAAQEAGRLSTCFTAEQLLTLVLNTASMWSEQGAAHATAPGVEPDEQRRTVIEAVGRLVAP